MRYDEAVRDLAERMRHDADSEERRRPASAGRIGGRLEVHWSGPEGRVPSLVFRPRRFTLDDAECHSAVDRAAIVDAANELLDNEAAYAAMAKVNNPYGDGRAARRIAEHCQAYLQK